MNKELCNSLLKKDFRSFEVQFFFVKNKNKAIPPDFSSAIEV